MQVLMFLKAVTALVTAIFSWLHDRRMAGLVATADEATSLKETVDAIDRAHDARAAAELVLDRQPDSLRIDDGFRRD